MFSLIALLSWSVLFAISGCYVGICISAEMCGYANITTSPMGAGAAAMVIAIIVIACIAICSTIIGVFIEQ